MLVKRKVIIYLKPVEREIEYDDFLISGEPDEIIDSFIYNELREGIEEDGEIDYWEYK